MVALPSRTKRAAFALVVIFLLSRVLFYVIGIHFDASSLGTFWQFLDPTLLRTRLLESLVNLHAQPPLFNLFLGLVLKVAPVHYTMVFHGVFLLLGVVLTMSIYQLLVAVGISEQWAFRLTVLFSISPASIVFENWLFYDYPLAVMFTLMALFFFRFANEGKVRDGVVFFSILTLVVLTRSLFHFVWVAGVVAFMYYMMRDHRRVILRAALMPLLVITAFYARNYVQFGSLSGSTWFGQHLARVTTAEVDEAERAKLVGEGKLTKMAMIPAFTDLRCYPAELWKTHRTGIPALDQANKESGSPNFNNAAYIGISKMYQQDAEYIAIHYPTVAATSMMKSAFFYLRAPNEFYMLRAQNDKMAPYETFFRRAFYGEVRDYPEHATKAYDANFEEHVLDSTPFVMLILIPATLFFGLKRIISAFRNKRDVTAAQLTIVFIAINLIYVSTICNIFEMGENNRIRFMMDPMFLVLGSTMAASAFAYARKLEARYPLVQSVTNWVRKAEPNFARQFRIF
jgi:hypothetical protein